MTDNPVVLLVIGICSIAFGIYAFLYPINVTRAVFLWPKFILPRMFGDNIPPKAREGLKEFYTEPEKYKQKNRFAVIQMRITGLVAVLVGIMFVLGALAAMLY